MKSLAQINSLLNQFSLKYGFNPIHARQGSYEWLQLKLGVISASNASKVVAKKDSETRLNYMCELVAQVCTGVVEEINAKALEWGKSNEDAARSIYEFSNNTTVDLVSFIFKDNTFREGCSPDGLTNNKGVEIKCPFNSANYIKFFTEDAIKPEYQWQAQFTIRVAEADSWDFAQYDPRMKKNPIKVLTIARDEEKQKILADKVPEFISDMDAMLEKVGIKFGDQWTRLTERKEAV